jgi:hypothetical protein
MWALKSSEPFEKLCFVIMKIPILLCVFSTSNIIFSLMLKFLFKFSGLVLEELSGKLVNMECDGNIVFQGN